MHITRRIALRIGLSAGIVVSTSFGSYASLTPADRVIVQQSLALAIGGAVQTYREGTTVLKMQQSGEKLVQESGGQRSVLIHRERHLRHQIVMHRRNVSVLTKKYGIVDTRSGALVALLSQQETFLRSNLHAAASDTDDALVSVMVDGDVARSLQERILSVRLEMIADVRRAVAASVARDTLRVESDQVLAALAAVEKKYDEGRALIAQSAETFDEIRRITAAVQQDVLRMQGELNRIDGRLRSKAQRDLVSLGLLDPSDIAAMEQQTSSNAWRWPVHGPVSAGFHDSSYKRFFGVPHEAIDIVTPQGTSIGSAAGGIVFLVKDGGALGYSYILIGHRDGYATLYGHISQALVQAGQEVKAGQTIALSGGTPGTPGAGPMTTAAHVHFEMMRNGEHLDPRTVLP